MMELSTSGEDVQDFTDLELIQHINVDCVRITKLLTGMSCWGVWESGRDASVGLCVSHECVTLLVGNTFFL